jgi:hypothetical protein
VAVRARRGRTAPGWRLAGLSLEDRIARGRAARRESPRSGHARWEPALGRPDPVTLLQEQAATRVPELVPIRYGLRPVIWTARYGLQPTPANALTTTSGLASPRHSGIPTSPGSTRSRPSKYAAI